MDSIQQYEIHYTQTAIEDINEKVDYISFQFHDIGLAEKWYFRLRDLIQENLSFLPLKYPLYGAEPWRTKGIRQFVTHNDVVLYSADTVAQVVYIHAVCTKGRDLAAHLAALEQE